MASFDYNPITGQLDLVGSGGASYIDGVVANPTALPVTLGTPALDSVYLAKAGSGVWLINRRPAGLYCRTANNGVAADWTYLGAFPEVNADGNWELYNSADPTKELKFDLSGISTGTTRTLTVPDASGTIQLTGHAASHIAGIKAQYNGGVEGMSENVFIRADNAGTAGNSITLSFDGIDDIDTVLAAWNSANPSNQATLILGDGGQVPDNGEEITLSGGVAGGSDPFKNINQNLGTTDTPVFDGLVVARNGVSNSLAFGNHVANFVAANGSADAPLVLIGGTGNIEIFKDSAISKALAYGFAVPSQSATDDFIVSLYNGSWGEKFRVAQDGTATIKGNIVLRDNDGNQTATFDAQSNLTANRTYDLPDASGTLALTSDIPAAFDPASPGTIGGTTPAAATFTNLTANTRVNLPNTNGTTAGDLYRNANTLRYRDSTNTERLLLNATDNLANLASASTARTNLGVGSSDAVTFGSIQGTPIGSTAAAAITGTTGTFSTLNATNGTITASAPVLDLSQTWNASGTTFTALRLNATNTASASGSLLMDLQVGGTTQFSVRRDGVINASNYYRFTGLNAGLFLVSVGGNQIAIGASPDHWALFQSTRLQLTGDLSLGRSASLGQSADTILARDDAGILAQRNAANAQTFRLYNTFTSTTNFERLNIIAQSAASVIIGTEKGSGGGSARGLEFRTDNVARLQISATGGIGFYGAAAATQPTAVADATDAASVITQLNALLSRMRTIGLIAT